ncbi:50S ribosomal protein L10 [Archaeoglobales archaeon ex4484_92]|nr:MAG: 50S ribosomal protein L10 [Archaeoglobales archaeon ex4484_92]
MAAIRGTPPRWKIEAVEELKTMLTSNPVVALVCFRGVPANQMQKIRREFRHFAKIKVVKNSLLERALDKAGGNYTKLKNYIEDQMAIIVCNENPFRLYRRIEGTKVPSPLKPNQISPVEVTIEEGPTPIPPGPAMGELQLAGIPVAIERGKVVVKAKTTIIKPGEVVKPEVARALNKLGIKPIKIGLDVKAIYDSGVILTPEVLSIDSEKVSREIQEAHSMALNLALNASYVTKETLPILIQKAYFDARNLAINAGIFAPEIMGDLLRKAHLEMLSLASLLPSEAVDEELAQITSTLGTTVSAEKAEEKVEKIEDKEKKEEEEEEEAKEEEAIEGLGALFG